jgi:hypothetical protein
MMNQTRYGVLMGCGVLLAAILFVTRIQGEMRDFEVYWEAGGRALKTEPLYRAADEHYQFKYLPGFAVLISPLAMLPLRAAKAVWFALSVGLLAGLLTLSLRLLPERRLNPGLLIGLTSLTMAKFYGHELVLGQSNILLAVLVLLGVSQLRSKRDTGAGLLLAASVLVKPYAIIFLPYLLIRRRVRALLAFGVGLVVALLLPAVVYGMTANMALLNGWLTTVTTSTVPTLVIQDNVSIVGMYSKWLGVGPLAVWLSGATIGAIGLLFVAVTRARRHLLFPEYLEMALLLTLIPLISPQGWDYVLLVSTPAVMCLINFFERFSTPYRIVVACALAVVGFSLFDVMGRTLYSVFMSLSIVTVCYLALVWSMFHLRARQIA